jgi:hypothetical protein
LERAKLSSVDMEGTPALLRARDAYRVSMVGVYRAWLVFPWSREAGGREMDGYRS